MPTVRCYVPLSVDQLTSLREDRRIPGPLRACTVTSALRAASPSDDQDEWEHAAIQAAATHLVEVGSPVIVAAVDLADRVVDSTDVESQVTVGDIDLPRVASLHVGDDVVTGDPDALVVGDGGIELSWYDTTEIDQVVELAEAHRPRKNGA